MDIIISMILMFIALVISISNGIYVGYALIMGFFLFVLLSLRRGHRFGEILKMSYTGGKKAYVVLVIFVLIGAVTGIWKASGTVPAIVYYGIRFIDPRCFILYAFLISSAISFLLGTSFGTVSTVGVALILVARSGNIPVDMAAGAIIAGAYFGDRCSPMSSSAALVANLTGTELYRNIGNMLKTSVVPFLLSIAAYFVISLNVPVTTVKSGIAQDIAASFKIHWIVLLPALIVLTFSVFRVNVRISMLVSIVAAFELAILYQRYSPLELLRFMLVGFRMDSASSLRLILQGGGILSMWQAAVVVYISCALSGLFEGTRMLGKIEGLTGRAGSRSQLFLFTAITSLITAAIWCSQTISAVLTHQLRHNSYETEQTVRKSDDSRDLYNTTIGRYPLALDLENTSIPMAALIPWNIAAFLPTETMGVSHSGYLPYAVYLYLLPVIQLIALKIQETKRRSID